MSARFEAIALKKLQEIIHDRGISAEAIFSKFDNNGDGSLDVEEFKRAVASITGQNAPDAIIRAVFSALDSDGNQGLDLAELIALVEGGQAPAVSGEVTEIEISDHTNSNFNGVYYKQDNPINGNERLFQSVINVQTISIPRPNNHIDSDLTYSVHFID